MPLQNRVDPFGNLFRTTARGNIMGNRGGAIHNASGALTVSGCTMEGNGAGENPPNHRNAGSESCAKDCREQDWNQYCESDAGETGEEEDLAHYEACEFRGSGADGTSRAGR